MNFETVRRAMGQKDPQNPQYDMKVTMFATFVNIEGITFTKNQKQTCLVKLQDDNGEAHNVHLYGEMPPGNLQNTRAEFNISAFSGQSQRGPYTGYQGFWNNRVTVRQDQAPIPNAYGPPAASPIPSPARQLTAPAVQPQQRDFAAEEQQKSTSIERQVCVKAVGEMAASRPEFTKYDAADWLAFYMHWIQTGEFPLDATHEPVDTTDYSQEESDLPPDLR